VRIAYEIIAWEIQGNRPLGRPGHSWERNIKMNVREVGCESVDWFELA
jgi:hypothetical protein